MNSIKISNFLIIFILLILSRLFGAVPVEVDSVKTFGSWQDSSGKHGEFRVIMTNLGWENIRYKIHIEKILFKEELKSKEIIESNIITEGPEGFHLINQNFKDNKFTFSYQSFDTLKSFDIVCEFSADGKISTVKSDK